MRRTKEQTAETREALLDAAEIVFDRRGVARATLEEIAREAGMTRGALYWHFDNKQELYAAMLERVRLPLAEGESALQSLADPFAALEDFAARIFRRVDGCTQTRRVYTIAFLRREHLPAESGLDEVEREMRNVGRRDFVAAFRRAQELGELRPDVTPELAATALQCHLVGIFYIGMQEAETFRLYEDGVAMVRCFLESYRAR